MRRFALVAGVAAVPALGAGAYAVAGGSGLIWDDNHFAKPGSLDDGKELLPQTTIGLKEAVAAAQRAQSGQLGQVDLEHFGALIVYKVDVGDREVRVDASDGGIAAIGPQS
jgi:uncharacterized membrane protein YkoI